VVGIAFGDFDYLIFLAYLGDVFEEKYFHLIF
jgi:hypothetical protein